MDEIKGGYIINSDFYGIHIDSDHIDFVINIEKFQIQIDFKNKYFPIENQNERPIEYLFLKDNEGTNITLFVCIKTKWDDKSFVIIFDTIVLGGHINQLQTLEPSELFFEMRSSPIPLLNIHLPKDNIFLDNENAEIQIQSRSNNVVLIIKSINKKHTLDDLEEIFFNILDIFFLCLGFYPYIEMEHVKYNDINISIYHTLSKQYQKGNSFAHWVPIITNKSTVDLKTAYPIFKFMFNENRLIIKVLTNAIHASDIIFDITLSLLIQCVEGYMRKWHGKKKFPKKVKNAVVETMINSLDNFDFSYMENSTKIVLSKVNIINSIKGSLGLLNEPSLRDRLKDAFSTNEFTQMILQYQIENKTYSEFIEKSIATRNQFSHMSSKDEAFKNLNEMIMAKDKYVLLLRLLMLDDLKIHIPDKGSLKRYIDTIDNNFETQIEDFEN